MKFLLHASLFTGLAVNRLKSQQLQPLAQLPGPARFAGQALTQHLPGAVAVASTSVSSEVSAQRWALKTSQWRVEVAQAGPSWQQYANGPGPGPVLWTKALPTQCARSLYSGH